MHMHCAGLAVQVRTTAPLGVLCFIQNQGNSELCVYYGSNGSIEEALLLSVSSL